MRLVHHIYPRCLFWKLRCGCWWGDDLCVSLCAVSSDEMSVCAGQGSDEVLVSQAVWDYLAAAGRPWLIDFQQKQGMSAGIIRRGEKGGCCAVRLQPVEGSRNSGAGVMDGPISSETRKAFIDLCRCARKEMSKQEGGTKRKRALLPWVGVLEPNAEGSVVQPPPLQPRRSQRQQQQRFRKPADEKACSMLHEVAQAKDMESTITAHGETEDNKTCSICMGDIVEKTTLEKCGHSFCRSCLDQAFKVKKACPVCRLVYGQLIGNQPANGTMIVERDLDLELPGHEGYGCICIIYSFPPGLQSVSRPRTRAPSDSSRGTSSESDLSPFCFVFLPPTARTPQPRCSVSRNKPSGLPPRQPRREPRAGPAAPGLWTAPYIHHRYLHDYGHAKCHHLEWHSPQDLNMGGASLVRSTFLHLSGTMWFMMWVSNEMGLYVSQYVSWEKKTQ